MTKTQISSQTLYAIPCAGCGGRGPHQGPGHAYVPAFVASIIVVRK